VAAVAVWDHQPNADELLAERLKTGWQVTPSLLREGVQVLGVACALH
jgi:hypothetical protein